jgi:hypothetical protein
MRFGRSSALDLLADALRRAEVTWQGGQALDWSAVPKSERDEWRALARRAATAVYREMSDEERRDAAVGLSPPRSRSRRHA